MARDIVQVRGSGSGVEFYDQSDNRLLFELTAAVASGSGGAADLSAIAEDVLPDDDDTYDLGSQAKRWADVFVSGGLYADDDNVLVKPLPFTAGGDDYVAVQVGHGTGRFVFDPLYNGQPFSFGAFAVLDGQAVTEYNPDTVFDGKRANVDYDQFALFTERATAENQTPNFGVPIFSARNFYWESDANVYGQLDLEFSAGSANSHQAITTLRRSGDVEAIYLVFTHNDSGLLSSLRGVPAFPDIPTADPGVGRKLWVDSGVLKITAAS